MTTPSDPPPRLPQELVDHIIDILANQWRLLEPDSQSRKTLGECMLVSRSFLTSVRRQLFRRLTLFEECTDALHDEPGSTDKMDGFLKVLKGDPLRSTPHPLAAQVRGIKLEMHGVPTSQNYLAKSEKTMAQMILEWNGERVQLYHILKATSNLDAFALKFMLPMDANSIHLGIFLAIEKVCHSTRITQLQFTNIYHFPVDLLAMCANLHELGLRGVSIAQPESLGSSTGADTKKPASTILGATWNKDSLRYLETLDTKLSADVVKAIKEAASKTSSPFSHLKTLQLCLHALPEPTSLEEWEILKSAARSLKCLCICGIHGDNCEDFRIHPISMINCTFSSVWETTLPWKHLPLRSYLSAHVEAAHLRLRVLRIPGRPILPPHPPFLPSPRTDDDRSYLPRLLLRERAESRRLAAPRQRCRRTTGHR